MIRSAQTPVLGFGGASMGSRKSRAQSLAALSRAYDAGVRWFDVAPSYGDGEAERVLGAFLSDARPGAKVCTKVGIRPGEVSFAKRVARPVLRAALAVAPGMRAAIKRNRPAAEKLPLTPALIALSIDESLTRLGREQVDMLALHDATPEEASRDETLAALEKIVASGKAAAVGIASSPEAALAGIAASPIYRFVQVANNPFEPGAARVADGLPAGWDGLLSTHSVYGASGMAATIAARIAASDALARVVGEAGYGDDPSRAATAFLADFALTAPRVDIVVMSMFSASHLRANLDRHASAAQAPREAVQAIAAALGGRA
jgi:aryl-alcohol dehydrogenase-like predicted oxidoreductase